MDGKESWLTLSQQSLQYKQGQPSQRRRQKSLKSSVKNWTLIVHSTCEEATDKKHGVVVSKEEDHLSIIVVVKGCPQRGRSPNHHHHHHNHLHNRPKREESPNHHLIIITIIFMIVKKRGESPSRPRRGERVLGGTTFCQFWESPRLQGMFSWFASGS